MKNFCFFLITVFLTGVSNAELRTWTAVNGKQVKAEFVSSLRGNVKLRLESGKLYDIPKDKLSKEDHNYISSLYKTDTVVGGGTKKVKKRISSFDLEPELQKPSITLTDLTVYRERGSKIPFTGETYTKGKDDVSSTVNFKDGLRHGKANLLTPNMFNGAIVQEWNNGQLIEETVYQGRKILWKKTGGKNGFKFKGISQEYTTNKNGKKHGLMTTWQNPDGTKGKRVIQSQVRYINGEVVKNSEKYWDPKGNRVGSLEETKSEFTKLIDRVVGE